MPLIDLKTDLKSLKYGKDRPGGGDSGQPFQQVDINKVDSGFNRFRMTKFDDGLVRGGVVGATNASLVDAFRIGKFLKDLPKGPLFVAKQVGLQLSSPKIETSKSGRGNIGRLGPTRFYNSGINTLAQIPVNAFGGHFVRHGLSPVQDDQTKYLAVAQENNTEKDNRLIKLKTRLSLGIADSSTPKDQVFLRKQELKSITAAGSTSAMLLKANQIQAGKIDDYVGGPGSVYGIGRTLIKRTPEYTNNNLKITDALNRAFNSKHIPEVKIGDSFDYGISTITGSALAKETFDLIKNTNLNLTSSLLNYIASKDDPKKDKYKALIQEASASQRIQSFTGLSNYSSSQYAPPKSTFPNLINDTPSTLNSPLLPSEPYSAKNTINRWGGALTASNDLGISDITGDTTLPNYNNVITYTSTDPKARYTQLRTQIDNKSVGKTSGFSSIVSKINKSGIGANALKQLSSLQSNRTNDKNIDEDTMAIKIVPVDAFSGKSIETLKFLAYLTNYSDNYDSGWSDVKYAGRSEKFYIFTDFKRNVQIEFNIPCFNDTELIEKHSELNRLVSILAGQYQNNFLGGVISKVTLGSYLVNQPGIINSLNFSPLPESPWDLDARLAQYIKVSFGFTVIHNFLPQYGVPFIDVNGAQTKYLEAKQKQLAEEEAAAAAASSTGQQAQLTTNNGTNTTTRANVFDIKTPIAKPVSAQSLQTQAQVTKQQQQAKKTTTVNARKSVGKTVPKKEEEKLVKIGGMPMPYPTETQFNSIIGGTGFNPNKGSDSPYSPSKPIRPLGFIGSFNPGLVVYPPPKPSGG